MAWTVELLVFGWVHSKYSRSNTHSFIPKVIINLILSFFGGVFNWNFHGDDLKEFLLITAFNSSFSAIKSPLFTVNNIDFQCEIEPNRYVNDHLLQCEIEYVLYSMKIPKFPHNVKSITVFYQLRCKETKFLWKCIKTFNRNKRNISWHNVCNTMKILQDNKQLFNRLHCTCMIDILQIRYRKGIETFNKPVHIKNQSQFTYLFKPNLLKQNKTIFTKNFGSDDNWAIYCAPNGLLRNDEGKIHFGLELYALPPDIQSIRVRIFGAIGSVDSINVLCNLSYEHYTSRILVTKMNDDYLKKGITVCLYIKLLTVNHIKYGTIPFTKWNAFGVDRQRVAPRTSLPQRPLPRNIKPKMKKLNSENNNIKNNALKNREIPVVYERKTFCQLL